MFVDAQHIHVIRDGTATVDFWTISAFFVCADFEQDFFFLEPIHARYLGLNNVFSSVTVRGVKVYISHDLVNRLFVYSHSVRVQYSGKKIIPLNVG